MKRIAIINPWSGNGLTGRKIPKILRALDGFAAEAVVSRYPGHCREIAEQASGSDGIIAVGGDGTVCEIIRGMDLARQTLALIPSGTGNSLARDLNLKDLEQSVGAATQGTLKKIDVMSVMVTAENGTRQEWFSASTISFGYVVRCTRLSNRGYKKLGKMCYPVVATLCAVKKELTSMELQYGNAATVCSELSCLLVSNTRHSANFEAFPGARIDDRLFDVMEIDSGFFRQMAHNISVLSGRHFYTPALVKQADRLQAKMQSPQDLLIDGELISDVVSVLITFLPQRLQCYCAA